ncbi:hypothetical protein ASPCADRAFT_210979 [Aspergillus carbonarius ITEM 5010]|uniref:Uncharacterized protein n=1 Tax=Aspergillus carbonarius (strain ITEM 5010) TaxID=602072 RepID=A0A1R3RAW7_ASPC5|nr:hypothetical protein ASPCADRAFT_210979 [Aspergillus carbonarius ITEM 5010]
MTINHSLEWNGPPERDIRVWGGRAAGSDWNQRRGNSGQDSLAQRPWLVLLAGNLDESEVSPTENASSAA